MKTKHLTYILGVIFVLLSIILIISINNYDNSNKNSNDKMLLGFCPTMEENAKIIEVNNENIDIKKYSSTKDVLYNLNKDKIDIALVGRIAKSEELKKGFNEKKLSQGLTLITNQKSAIYSNELSNIKIHTYLQKEEIKNTISDMENIIYYDNINDAISNGINDVVLINWEDYKDEYELLIPIDANNNKIKKFRIPVLYSYKNLEQIKID